MPCALPRLALTLSSADGAVNARATRRGHQTLRLRHRGRWCGAVLATGCVAYVFLTRGCAICRPAEPGWRLFSQSFPRCARCAALRGWRSLRAASPSHAACRARAQSLRREVEQAQTVAGAPPLATPPFRDAAAWEVYCLGSRSQRSYTSSAPRPDAPDTEAEADEGPSVGHPPALCVLAAMDEVRPWRVHCAGAALTRDCDAQVEATATLHRAIDWLEQAPSLRCGRQACLV